MYNYSFTVLSFANGICVAANADVSASGSIVVAAEGIGTFSKYVSSGTTGDAATVPTADLTMIEPNSDLATITAESPYTVGTCIWLLLLQRMWGQSVGGRCPLTESIVLCFRAPPRQPRFVGNRTAMPTSTSVLHVVAPRRHAQESVEAIDRQCTCKTACLRNTID